MIWRCSLFKLSMYFLSWKYRWFSYFSHLTKEILLWCHASLQSASIIWAANLSLISTYFHNVWVKMSAKSSSRFRMSWFSWNLTSLMLNSSISRFMKTRICKSAEIIKNKCNWNDDLWLKLHDFDVKDIKDEIFNNNNNNNKFIHFCDID